MYGWRLFAEASAVNHCGHRQEYVLLPTRDGVTARLVPILGGGNMSEFDHQVGRRSSRKDTMRLVGWLFVVAGFVLVLGASWPYFSRAATLRRIVDNPREGSLAKGEAYDALDRLTFPWAPVQLGALVGAAGVLVLAIRRPA